MDICLEFFEHVPEDAIDGGDNAILLQVIRCRIGDLIRDSATINFRTVTGSIQLLWAKEVAFIFFFINNYYRLTV